MPDFVKNLNLATHPDGTFYSIEEVNEIADALAQYAEEQISPDVSEFEADIEQLQEDVTELQSDVSDLKDDIDTIQTNESHIADTAYICTEKTINTTASGWRLNELDGLCSNNSSYKLVKYAVVEGDLIKVISDDRFQFQTVASVPSTGTSNRIGKTYGIGEFYLYVPTGATYLIISTPINGSVANCYTTSVKIDALDALMTLPEITFTSGYLVNYNNGKLIADETYKYAKIDVRLFQGGNISGTTAIFPNGIGGLAFKDVNDNYIAGYRNTTANVYKWQYDVPIPQNAAYLYLPLRIASESDYVAPTFPWDVVVQNVQKMQGDIDKAVTEAKETKHTLDNARHIKGNTIAPLTLLHFSDLHADTGALARIMADAENIDALIDDKICTGDLVANTAGQITSWWDADVMTCIGNHDCASYNASTGYNWTALSMADRDAYYIAPFESAWDIVHTSGTSYYYKDYDTQKVRLIVMDAMLYVGTPGAEASAQTDWLAGLLSDAITNSMHVIIAIHSPHGGATAKDCSFSRYGQTPMPTNSDCNTPQIVIDTVATAITDGLHFIGYLVGHTHQDNIWDAENDGTQLMFCITCANVSDENQWKNSDQYRGIDEDAFNLVTIDTVHTLVKLVRCGGANIDDHMRTRKAICFNYSTGQIVGEVL